MKEYRTPTLSLLFMPKEDILNASGNMLEWGGDNGIEEIYKDEQFGGFVMY